MAYPKIRLHVFSNNRPQPNRRVYLERKQGENEPLETVASLVTDHTGYVSFSLAPSRRQPHEGKPDLNTILLRDLSVRVDGDATLETPLHSLFGLPTLATAQDIGCRSAKLAIQPKLGAASNDNSEAAEGDCFVRPNGLSIEDPDLCDYEVSPASLVDHRLIRRGDDYCDRPFPATGTISETDIWRVVVYNEADIPIEEHSANALVNPADKPVEQTGLLWGLLERYRQTWTHLGHSLGEIVYSLALAPGESTQLAVIEWSREDLGQRDDSIESSEHLEHDQRTDRGIEETTKAALREDQGGGSFQSGLSASIPIKGVQLNVGIGGGVTHSWGKRDLSSEGKQNLHQSVIQKSKNTRTQNSTVIVQGRAREDNRLAVRAVANHNHCHALTIQYFEVLRHLALTTRFVGREPAVLVPHAVLSFDRAVVLRWRHLLGPVALDAAVANGFAALERSVTGRKAPQAPEGEVRPAAGTGADTPASGLGNLKRLRITISSSPTRSHIIKEFSRGGILLDWEGRSGAPRPLTVLTRGMSMSAVSFPVEDTFFLILDADLAESGILDLAPSKLKSISIVFSNAHQLETASWAVQRVIVDGADGNSWQTLLDKQELLYFEAAPKSSTDKKITFGAAPTKSDSAARPGVETIDDKIAIENLIKHISSNAVHYSRAVWLGLDDGARRMLIAKQFGQSVASSIDGPPLAISGNHVAFRWRGEMKQWFKAMVESESFNKESLSPETSIVFLPTRGLFAEAMLGHCNACEKRDVTRMWDWTEATVEPLPTLTGLSPGQKGSTVIPDAPQLPSSVLNIQAAPAMPDPSGLAATLAGITQGGIFRDMSGMSEVTSLLKTLSNNASLDQATRQKAAEAAAKTEAATRSGGGVVPRQKPAEQFDRLTVAKEVQKAGEEFSWNPDTTEMAVQRTLVAGEHVTGESKTGNAPPSFGLILSGNVHTQQYPGGVTGTLFENAHALFSLLKDLGDYEPLQSPDPTKAWQNGIFITLNDLGGPAGLSGELIITWDNIRTTKATRYSELGVRAKSNIRAGLNARVGVDVQRGDVLVTLMKGSTHVYRARDPATQSDEIIAEVEISVFIQTKSGAVLQMSQPQRVKLQSELVTFTPGPAGPYVDKRIIDDPNVPGRLILL